MTVQYYMIGGAGYLNFGDELMLRCWLDTLEATPQIGNIVIDGGRREYLAKLFADRAPRVTAEDMLHHLSLQGPRLSFWDAVIRGLTFFDRGGFENYADLKTRAAAFTKADVIHLHGGGYLNFHFAHNGFLLGVAVAQARKSGALLFGTGLGLTPLNRPTAKQMAQLGDLFAEFSILETRDPESVELVRKIWPDAPVESGLDDTFLGPIRFTPAKGKRLHLSWTAERMVEKEFGRIEAYLQETADRYDELIFWNCAGNDSATFDALSPKFPKLQRFGFNDMLTQPLPVRPGDHMITSRFHPHLVGARGGALGCYYSHGKYYDVKHGSVTKLGSGFFPLQNKPLSWDSFENVHNTLVTDTAVLSQQKLRIANRIIDLVQPPKVAATGT